MLWKPIQYRWRWQLQSTPAELWPYVADTQRFNRAAKLPNIAYTEVPLPTGGSRRFGRTSKFGIVVEFEDHPFDWVKEQGFSNLRIFQSGPVARTFAQLTLKPNEKGTLLCYDIDVTPANLLGLLGIPYQFGWEMRRNFERTFRQIDAYIQARQTQPFDLRPPALGSAAQARLERLGRQLADRGHDERWVRRLTDLVINESDLNLMRIRPYPLADDWQAPRREALEMFLSGAKLGLLNMRWDVMCPLCRGSKASTPTLDGLQVDAHCPSCNIHFQADFSQNVELTFTPHPQIRQVNESQYCVGGPMVTPHILVHHTLQPEARETVTLALEPDGYRFRTQQQENAASVDFSQPEMSAINTLGIEITPTGVQLSPQTDPQHPAGEMTLIMANRSADPQRLYVERAGWYTDAVTAAYVTALQHFRDLFSDEVLRPGEEIGIRGMTVLFSDLVGSTAMYNRWGDAPSYGLVREQFAFLQRIVRRHEGTIVKTIGDAIMAAFSDPVQGVAAALAIQQEISDFNTTHPDQPLTIKLGLHHGPCLAVTLNGRLDYFGTTVNLAARLEGQSQGGDVVISDVLAQDPAVQKLLAASPVTATPFNSAIKGFDEQVCLYRLKHTDS